MKPFSLAKIKAEMPSDEELKEVRELSIRASELYDSTKIIKKLLDDLHVENIGKLNKKQLKRFRDRLEQLIAQKEIEEEFEIIE